MSRRDRRVKMDQINIDPSKNPRIGYNRSQAISELHDAIAGVSWVYLVKRDGDDLAYFASEDHAYKYVFKCISEYRSPQIVKVDTEIILPNGHVVKGKIMEYHNSYKYSITKIPVVQ